MLYRSNEAIFLTHKNDLFCEAQRSDENESPVGDGHFAEVRRGTLNKNYPFQKAGASVAVKLIRNEDLTRDFNLDATKDYIVAVLSEIKLLKAFHNGHNHLVKFYGVTRHNDDLGIVLEYCSGGSLDKYLRAKRQSFQFPRNIGTDDLLKLHKWAVQIASAIQFLSDKNIVHGDLATRNVLLDENDEAKVTDFGSALNLYHYKLYARSSQTVDGSRIPYRPDLKFSVASDVWSYGVLLWELYTFGEIPWHDYEWTSDFVRSLVSGKTLDKPHFATDKIYKQVICKCLSVLECNRPRFAGILDFYSSLEIHNIPSGRKTTENVLACRHGMTVTVRSHVLQQ